MSTSRQHIGDAPLDLSVGAEQLRELLDPVCTDAGYELVEIELKTGGTGQTLRIYIDYPSGSDKAVSFEDCETLSREVSAILDVEDPISSKYNLEVSSPGIDRPLRSPAHFRRFLGSDVKVALSHGLHDQGRRRNYKGVLISVADDDSSITIDVDGTHFDLPLADLSSARLIPDWSALMKGQGKRA